MREGKIQNSRIPQIAPGSYSQVLMISPEMADQFLTSNEGNRKLSNRHVERLAGFMKEGRWVLNNDSICFSPSGRLLNGQHRLHAIASSGVTVPMGVLYNVSEEAFKWMDTETRRRRAADFIGGPRARSQESLARFLETLPLSDSPSVCPAYRGTLSNEQLLDRVGDDPVIEEAVVMAGSYFSSRLVVRIPHTSAAAFCYDAINAGIEEEVGDFLRKLSTGEELAKGDAVLALRNYLLRGRHKALSVSSGAIRRIVYAMLLRMWEYHAKGTKCQKIYVPKSFPAIYIPTQNDPPVTPTENGPEEGS